MSNAGGTALQSTPEHACQAVRTSLDIIQKDLSKPANEQIDPEASEMAGNLIVALCSRLCISGCTREQYNRAKTAGLELPTSVDQETLFALVSVTLGTELLFSEPEETVGILEMPKADGNELREIYKRRMDVFDDPEFLSKVSETHGMEGIEQARERLREFITPVDDDAFDELAKLVDGNVRSALYILSYLQEVFAYFKSDDPESKIKAALIEVRGFKPGNPWGSIGVIDIAKVGAFLEVDGHMQLPIAYGNESFYVTENPDESRLKWRTDADVLEVSDNTPVPYLNVHSRELPSAE